MPSAWSFKLITRKVMSEIADTFERRGSMYARIQGDQVHGISFQWYREEYTINVAFHYAFLPSFNEVLDDKELHAPLQKFRIIDCLFNARLARFKSPITDSWTVVDEDDARTTRALIERVRAAIQVLDKYASLFGRPEDFLSQYPASKLFSRIDESEDPWAINKWIHCGNPDWSPDSLRLIRFLKILSERNGDHASAQLYHKSYNKLVYLFDLENEGIANED